MYIFALHNFFCFNFYGYMGIRIITISYKKQNIFQYYIVLFTEFDLIETKTNMFYISRLFNIES